MTPRAGGPQRLPQSPLRVFALVLLVVFAVEGLIMLSLPRLPPSWRGPFFDSLLDATMLTVAAAPAVWYLAVRPLRRLFELRGELLRRVFETQEQERARIARDLHDGVGQQLTALLVGLRGCEEVADLDDARTRARDLRELAALAHGEVRRLARGLRPVVLEEFGLATAMSRLCEDFTRAHGIAVQLRCDPPELGRLEATLETALYRIAQEALTNVARHAGARSVDVALARDDASIVLSVHDDGQGFDASDADPRGGFGISSMRERAAMLGGTLQVRTRRDEGTTLELRVPGRS